MLTDMHTHTHTHTHTHIGKINGAENATLYSRAFRTVHISATHACKCKPYHHTHRTRQSTVVHVTCAGHYMVLSLVRYSNWYTGSQSKLS